MSPDTPRVPDTPSSLKVLEPEIVGPENAFETGSETGQEYAPRVKVLRLGAGSGWIALALLVIVPVLLFAGFFVFLGVAVVLLVLRAIFTTLSSIISSGRRR